MEQKLARLLAEVESPTRYTGGEMNAVEKPFDEAELTFAFCFPDTYEVGMSHLGLKILYAILNDLPWALCERVFMPWKDMADGMRREGLALYSLESKTPISRFDVVGFTLQYEMSYSNILEMLSLGGVPVLNRERGERDPIVVAGGPCAFNPEPLHAFIDAFMIGDGEESIVETCEVVRQAKKDGVSRNETLFRLSQVRGVYVPSLYEASYNDDGTLRAFTPTRAGVPARVEKRIVHDLDAAAYPTKIPVPYAQIVHDRIMLEIMRGCTRGCRFCQAGMLYRPVRERSADTLVRLAEALERSTGYEEISLSSLSSGDYSQLSELADRLTKAFADKKVALSLPSLRVDSAVKDAMLDTRQVKKSSLTFAPEAGTQRLRDAINKGVTEGDLMRSVSDAFQNGWSAVKLYFMMGLPTETDEDLLGIAELARKVVRAYFAVPKEQRAKGLRVSSSAAVFVPKPFTPFQWSPQDTLAEMARKTALLRDAFRQIKGATFNWHEGVLSRLEACFARGDRRLADVLYSAWRKGARLDGWSECFKPEFYAEAFSEHGLSMDFYACRERAKDELLPWDFIDAGIRKEFLWNEYEKSLRAETTCDCRQGCQGCGLAGFEGGC